MQRTLRTNLPGGVKTAVGTLAFLHLMAAAMIITQDFLHLWAVNAKAGPPSTKLKR